MNKSSNTNGQPTNQTESQESYYSIQKLVNTYKLLEKISPPTDQDYVIYAYFLYSEPKNGVHGKHIYLGAYPTKKKAFKMVEKIIKKTGHDCIYVTQTANWEDIDEKKHPDRTLYVDNKTKAKDLEEQFKEKILKQTQEETERELLSQELDEQVKNELDPTTIEHYAHNWFNAIKNKASYEYHKEQMKYFENEFNQRADKIKQQYISQPEMEKNWLNVYKERLEKRKEADIYVMLKEGHDKLLSTILNTDSSTI